MKFKKVTIVDIASLLGITPSTVSRALKNDPRISSVTKKAVLEVAESLKYQPNRIASALRSGKSQLIAVLVPRINRSFFSSVVRGVEEVANKANYSIVVCQSYEDSQKEIDAIDVLLNAQVDGIIASIGKNTDDVSHFEKLIAKGIPLVLFDRISDKLHTSQVIIDDFLGSYMATEHLILQGCRKLVHFTSTNNIILFKERLRGFKEALAAHAIPFEETMVVKSQLQLEDGIHCMNELLKKGNLPDAIFSASDYAAMGAMQVLKENRIPVPGRVAIVGFSNEPFTSFTEPGLSSVEQFPIEMGRRAAEMFLEMIKMKSGKPFVAEKTVLQPKLILRGSSLKKNGVVKVSGE